MKREQVHVKANAFGIVGVVFVTLLTLISGGPAASAHQDPEKANGVRDARDKDCTGRCAKELRVAREATAKYRSVAQADQDGYVPVSSCVTAADEPGHDPNEGTMGIHFLDVERDGNTHDDQRLDVREPENLLYVPDAMVPGGLRLVAIEYSIPVLVNGQEWRGPEPPPGDVEPAPELFEHAFNGPMRGHDPAELQAWHYDLHVWAWSDNPTGTFAQFNPAEDCDPSTSPEAGSKEVGR